MPTTVTAMVAAIALAIPVISLMITPSVIASAMIVVMFMAIVMLAFVAIMLVRFA